MPAYRSEAEGEIRTAVVARLRELRPNARIMHEINVSSYGNRIDVLAVDRAEIIAVEIKSAKDKLDRLPAQMSAMRGVAHHVIAALHEKFLVEKVTNKYAAHYERDGVFYRGDEPDIVGWREGWIYPVRVRATGDRDDMATWHGPEPVINQPVPPKAIDMLWRDELLELCSKNGVAVGKRPNMRLMSSALRWQLSGRDLTLGICAALRARKAIEADPAIEWSIAA